MLHNYLAAALRNLAHNKLYATISIVGLSFGLCAAILAALLIRNHLTHDRFIHGYEHTYLGISVLQPKGRAPDYNVSTHGSLAQHMKLNVAGVEDVTRLMPQTVTLRRDSIEAKETIYWADPNVFDVLPMPVASGDLRNALRRADAIVLSTSKARKYFGDAEVVGRTIHLDGLRPMVVAAVIEDLPRQSTDLESDIFASGLTSISELARFDRSDQARGPDATGAFSILARTYVRLASNTSIADVQDATQSVVDDLWPSRPPGVDYSVELVRIDKLHLFAGLNPGIGGRIALTAFIGAMILLLASLNFVNLNAARASRRATEVGIRKVVGAGRGSVMIQFLGEAFIYVLLASLVAVALAEAALPFVNAFLGTGATFQYWRDPALLAAMSAGALLLALCVGFYPALILASLKPAYSFKAMSSSPARYLVQRALVLVQFAILVGLIIAAGVAYQQRAYALDDALRVDTDQILMIRAQCNPTLTFELRNLEGVQATSCTGQPLLTGEQFDNIELKDGGTLAITLVPAGAGLMELHGLDPVAGRFFASPRDDGSRGARAIINETAVQRLGFASPQAALGQPFAYYGEIIGVAPDFSFNAASQPTNPTVYVNDTDAFDLIAVKLSGEAIPETLAAIDKFSIAAGLAQPLERFFLDDYIQTLYLELRREAQALAVFALVAVVLACLGLFGLSASAAERRTKEIGVRKALGAETRDVVRLLVWQFAQPVVFANLLAWPLAAWAMSRWLEGFANRVDLSVWLFIAASALALTVALATVGVHSYFIARAKPVDALRYE